MLKDLTDSVLRTSFLVLRHACRQGLSCCI